jgi:predicted phage tail protein
MTEIVLHGLVSKKFKAVHKMANIRTPIDAVFAIDANYDGFKNFFLKEASINNYYQFIVDGDLVKNANQALEKKEIKKIDIVPYIGGSGPFLVAFAVNLAIGLVMAGIQYLMTPIPENEPKLVVAQLGGNSFWFASKSNFTQQYLNAPIGYGELRVGSNTIETQIKATNRNETVGKTTAGGSISSSAGAGGGGVGGGGGSSY